MLLRGCLFLLVFYCTHDGVENVAVPAKTDNFAITILPTTAVISIRSLGAHAFHGE